MNLNDLSSKHRELCDSMDALTAALHEFPRSEQTHSKQLREWERFVMHDGAVTDGSGNATVGGPGSHLRPAPNGWEAYLTSVAVTVAGASAAATIANYVGGVGDGNLFDYANALFGNTPSRIVGFYDLETVYFEPGESLSIVIAGAVTSQQVTVRVTGKRRQL